MARSSGATTAVRYRLGTEWRARWKAWLGLALSIGIAGGITLAASAGARRTASAYPRLRAAVAEEDVLFAPASPNGKFNDLHNPVLTAVDRLPEVERAGRLAQIAAFAGRSLADAELQGFGAMVLADGSGYEISRPKLLGGRLPDRRRENETLINPLFARAHRLRVGSRFPVLLLSSDAHDLAVKRGTPYKGPLGHVTLTVTGIGRFARDVIPTTVNDEAPLFYVTPSLFAKYPWSLINYGSILRLEPGADIERFRAEAIAVAGRYKVPPAAAYFTTERDRTAAVERAVRPQALALALLAAVVLLALLLVAGQALSRQVFIDATDSPGLGAMGMTRGQRFALALARVALVAVTGAAVAVLVAIVASPAFPIGPARDAEPSAGFDVDTTVLAAGFAALALAFLLRGILPSWRGASASPSSLGVLEPSDRRPSRVAEVLGRTGLRPAPVIGVRMAFEPGRGRAAVPVRSAMVTTALAVAVVVAVASFATNLDRLVATPARYGWNWTASTGFGFDPTPRAMTEKLVGDRAVAGVAGGNYLDLNIGGRTVTAVTFDQLKGSVGPAILAGRAPRRPGELALGARTMRARGLAIGDRVQVKVEGKSGSMRIVGRAVFPRLGSGSFTPTDMGEGAAMTNVAATALGVDTSDPKDRQARYSVYFVRAAPGVSFATLSSRLGRELAGLIEECPSPYCVSGPQRPGDIVAYSRVRSTSTALIALVVAMAVAALAQSLVTSARRRRRDIAILKTLGFVGRDVSRAARWQGLALAAAALIVGIPIGLVLGRGAWTIFADELGVANDATLPIRAVLLAIPVTLAIAALVAVVPARLARRTRPASVLRSL